MFIFFACQKKTNQQGSGERKDSLSLAVSLLAFGSPALLEKSRRLGMSLRSPESFFYFLLHCLAA